MKVRIDWEEGEYDLVLNQAHVRDTDYRTHALCQACVTAEPDDPEAVEVEPWFVRHYLATLDQWRLIQQTLARLDNQRPG
jgi:hypothetical protein